MEKCLQALKEKIAELKEEGFDELDILEAVNEWKQEVIYSRW